MTAEFKTTAQIEQAFSTILTLTRYLTNSNEHPNKDVEVKVSATGPQCWRVSIYWLGFSYEETAQSLGEALHQMLTNLSNRVSTRLEEGHKLLL